MKPEFRWAIVLILVLSGLTYVVAGLVHTRDTQVHKQGNLITRSEFYDLFEERRDSFADDLRLQLEVIGVEQQDGPVVRVRLTFINLLSQSLVLRKPDRVAFQTASGCPVDGKAHLYRDTGEEVQTMMIFFADCGGRILPDSTEAFVELASRETYSSEYRISIPLMFVGNNSFEDVLAGNYKIGIDYFNLWAGYEMPYELQPTMPASAPGDDWDVWFMSQKVMYDLNAWVGEVSSNRVSFVIPPPQFAP